MEDRGRRTGEAGSSTSQSPFPVPVLVPFPVPLRTAPLFSSGLPPALQVEAQEGGRGPGKQAVRYSVVLGSPLELA